MADYSRFISGTVNADKNMFTEDDKERMLSFYEASATEDEESGRVRGYEYLLNVVCCIFRCLHV